MNSEKEAQPDFANDCSSGALPRSDDSNAPSVSPSKEVHSAQILLWAAIFVKVVLFYCITTPALGEYRLLQLFCATVHAILALSYTVLLVLACALRRKRSTTNVPGNKEDAEESIDEMQGEPIRRCVGPASARVYRVLSASIVFECICSAALSIGAIIML